jgi:hypothetical protein
MHHSSLCLLSAFGNFLLEVPGGGGGGGGAWVFFF